MKNWIFLGLIIACLCQSFTPLTPYNLNGRVITKSGVAIIGANIRVANSNKSAITGKDGRFSLADMSGKELLIISAGGYQSKQLRLNRQVEISIILETSNALKEILASSDSRTNAPEEFNKTFMAAGKGVMVRGIRPLNSRIPVSGTRNYGIGDGTQPTASREGYDEIAENAFVATSQHPLSTFSIDVDAASYSNVRRFIDNGMLPPAGAVRVEEMINYFNYEYRQPDAGDPFGVQAEVSICPWNKDHQLVSLGLQGKRIPNDKLPPANLVFLVDVSGSMQQENKLPLVRSSLKLLVDQLRDQDKVSIVVYAGSAGLVLPSTSGSNKITIKSAIDRLEAGGSTAGGEGIQLAYKIARENFLKDGTNRVILCTDGDFNVGVSSDDGLISLVEGERKSGVFLTVLGYGMGNYQDAKMQKLADKGNGNHAYIDNLNEAKKVLVREAGGTLFTIAKDVKLQVEFNPAKVKGYRLIGYENRILAKEDFNDDTKDAGEMGSGHTVTALYEIIPVSAPGDKLRTVDSLRYQVQHEQFSETNFAGELLYVKIRYKEPNGDKSNLAAFPVEDRMGSIMQSSENFRFAAAVAGFGMWLRGSANYAQGDIALVQQLASGALGSDVEGYRREFLELVKKAATIKAQVKNR